jgi:hypothetical protein
MGTAMSRFSLTKTELLNMEVLGVVDNSVFPSSLQKQGSRFFSRLQNAWMAIFTGVMACCEFIHIEIESISIYGPIAQEAFLRPGLWRESSQ